MEAFLAILALYMGAGGSGGATGGKLATCGADDGIIGAATCGGGTAVGGTKEEDGGAEDGSDDGATSTGADDGMADGANFTPGSADFNKSSAAVDAVSSVILGPNVRTNAIFSRFEPVVLCGIV
jgi:hypothetical protein